MMAVVGKVNTNLVSQLQSIGVNAIGLNGLDGQLIRAERKSAIISVENGKRRVIRDDFTGKISGINDRLINTLLSSGYLPVVAPLAISPQGEPLNVDADRAAAEISSVLKADKLLLLTAVPGLMKDFPDEDTLIPHIKRSQLDTSLEYAQGRMKKKVLGAKEALNGGVGKAIISDGRVSNPITGALNGNGTVIK